MGLLLIFQLQSLRELRSPRCRTAPSRSSAPTRLTLGNRIGPGIMHAVAEPTTDGRKRPGGERDVDIPGNMEVRT